MEKLNIKILVEPWLGVLSSRIPITSRNQRCKKGVRVVCGSCMTRDEVTERGEDWNETEATN